jgi:hypothetical protein
MTDARTTNWRFVVPAATGSQLVLPVGDEQPPGAVTPARTPAGLRAALAEGPWTAVVAADLSRWTSVAGLPTVQLLALLADAVAPGGYLFAGFPGRLYPMHLASRGAVLPARAKRVVRRRGLELVSTYVALPTASCPALIVPVDSAAELDYVLRNLTFPYTPSNRPVVGRARQELMRVMQAAAQRAPHDLRVAGAPGHAMLAVRPPVSP